VAVLRDGWLPTQPWIGRQSDRVHNQVSHADGAATAPGEREARQNDGANKRRPYRAANRHSGVVALNGLNGLVGDFEWFYRPDESVAMTGNRFDEEGRFGTIVECLPQLLHRSVQAVVKLDEGAFGPKLPLKLFA
jgi:hypothetical protein